MDVDDPDRPDSPLFGMYTGVVLDREDPEKLGRVRIQIPGLIEEGTEWAFPLGMGGGAAQRGTVFVPPLGAEVAVWFRMGDIDQPYYFGGHLGRGEQLTGTEGDPDAYAIETESYVVLIDERPESRSLTLRDKASGNQIQMNGVTQSLSIDATTQINITSKGFVYINGLEVIIQGIPAGFGRV